MSKTVNSTKAQAPIKRKYVITESEYENHKKNQYNMVQKYVKTSADYQNEKENNREIIDMLEKALEEERKDKHEIESKLNFYEDTSIKTKKDESFHFYNEDEINNMIQEARLKSKKQDDERREFYSKLCRINKRT